MWEASTSTVVSQQETPTHLLHSQAVDIKCQQSALNQMTTQFISAAAEEM